MKLSNHLSHDLVVLNRLCYKFTTCRFHENANKHLPTWINELQSRLRLGTRNRETTGLNVKYYKYM
jgi:hypothetical protein